MLDKHNPFYSALEQAYSAAKNGKSDYETLFSAIQAFEAFLHKKRLEQEAASMREPRPSFTHTYNLCVAEQVADFNSALSRAVNNLPNPGLAGLIALDRLAHDEPACYIQHLRA